MKINTVPPRLSLAALFAGGLALSAPITSAQSSASLLACFDASRAHEVSPMAAASFWGGLNEALSLPLVPAARSWIQVDPSFRPARLRFERNDGQFDPEVEFLARGCGHALFLAATEAVMVLGQSCGDRSGLTPAWREEMAPARERVVPARAVLRMSLAGANPHALMGGETELPGKVNYFIGNDPSRWRTNIPTYAQVRFQGVYPGIDLVYYANQGHLEYDFVVAPGADPNAISLAFEGADELEIAPHGDLRLAVGGQTLRWRQPKVYQQVAGQRVAVAGNYVLKPTHMDYPSRLSAEQAGLTHQVAFHLAGYDTSQPLIIDPVLVYSTYLGGSGLDEAFGIAVDPQGNAYVTGETDSGNFPTRNALQGPGGQQDVFVTKFSPTGELLYSTYLGGNAVDYPMGIAVDPTGSAYLTGVTYSTNFPVRNALHSNYYYVQTYAYGLLHNGFLVKVAPDGSALSYSTYLPSGATAAAVDSSGSVCVVGWVLQEQSTDFPTKNAVQPQIGGAADGYIMKLDPSGTNLIYATFLGGSANDRFEGVALDKEGSACVVGFTRSLDFPVTNAIQPQFAGGVHDGVFAKLSPDGSKVLFASYWGGSDDDYLRHITAGPEGDLCLCGETLSSDFPVVKPFQAGSAGLYEGFVARIKSDGTSVIFSTYFGGSGDDNIMGIALDPAGNIYIAGSTGSPDLPVVGALRTSVSTNASGFLGALSPDGSKLLFSTYWGGSGGDYILGLALDPNGNIYVAGNTFSADFPTTNAIQPGLSGGGDAFVTKFSPLESSPPGQVFMQISRSGDIVEISWPASASSFVLESTESLTAPSWSVVGDTPTLLGGDNVLTLGLTNAARFFRLKQP